MVKDQTAHIGVLLIGKTVICLSDSVSNPDKGISSGLHTTERPNRISETERFENEAFTETSYLSLYLHQQKIWIKNLTTKNILDLEKFKSERISERYAYI